MRSYAVFATVAFLGLIWLAGCGEDLTTASVTALSSQAASAIQVGRLDFLREKDSTRAYPLDSGYDIKLAGLGPFDPPYVPGQNQLTVLGDVGGAMRVERTIPLSPTAVACNCMLSPDGDTALCSAWDPLEAAPKLIVVRGLRSGTGYVADTIALPDFADCIAFSPDGKSAVLGLGLSECQLQVGIVSGLPDCPLLAGTLPVGNPVPVKGSILSLEVNHAGDRVLLHAQYHDCDDAPRGYSTHVQVIFDPFPGDRARVSAPLTLPRWSAVPPSPPWEGLPTALAIGDAVLLCDGDTALVPSAGWVSLAVQPDAQIFLVRGVRSGELRVARTLGPEDGVQLTPLEVALSPDADSVVVTNLFPQSVSVVSGLSDTSFENISIETFPVSQASVIPAVTPDGRTLLVGGPMGPVDNCPPPHILNYALEAGQIHPIGARVIDGPIHMSFIWVDSNFNTFPPGLTDHVNVFTADLHPAVGTLLRRQIDTAVAAADLGNDEVARNALEVFRREVELLRRADRLNAVEARVLDTLAGTGLKVLD